MNGDKKVIGVVDLTPTWSGLIDVLVELSSKGDAIAKGQLKRLALFADEVNEDNKEKSKAAGTDDEIKYTRKQLYEAALQSLSLGMGGETTPITGV